MQRCAKKRGAGLNELLTGFTSHLRLLQTQSLAENKDEGDNDSPTYLQAMCPCGEAYVGKGELWYKGSGWGAKYASSYFQMSAIVQVRGGGGELHTFSQTVPRHWINIGR